MPHRALSLGASALLALGACSANGADATERPPTTTEPRETGDVQEDSTEREQRDREEELDRREREIQARESDRREAEIEEREAAIQEREAALVATTRPRPRPPRRCHRPTTGPTAATAAAAPAPAPVIEDGFYVSLLIDVEGRYEVTFDPMTQDESGNYINEDVESITMPTDPAVWAWDEFTQGMWIGVEIEDGQVTYVGLPGE